MHGCHVIQLSELRAKYKKYWILSADNQNGNDIAAQPAKAVGDPFYSVSGITSLSSRPHPFHRDASPVSRQ